MSSVFASLPVNPFEADVIREPREVTFSVQGLNDGALNHLIAEFQRLTVGELPRSPIPPPKAQLVVSPEAGYGKSHLLGRLFQAVGLRATQIYLLPFQAPKPVAAYTRGSQVLRLRANRACRRSGIGAVFGPPRLRRMRQVPCGFVPIAASSTTVQRVESNRAWPSAAEMWS